MTCDRCRAALSARLDGEDSGEDVTPIDAHLATCAQCQSWFAGATDLHRAVRLAPAAPVPDRGQAILAAIDGEPPMPARDRSLRLGLAIVGFVQIVVALPALLLGEDAGLPMHTARHLGSFAVALGIGFLVAAWRPQRAAGLVPVVAALVLCLAATATADLAAGRTAALGEAYHSTEVLGLVLLWLLARPFVPQPRFRAV